MCYQTRQIRTVKDLEMKYKVGLSNPAYRDLFDKPAYHLNGFSHPNMLIIPQQKPKVLAPGIWGIVPPNKQAEDIKSYYKESIRYGSGLNARSEKLFDHFIYRRSVFSQRCIIPVTGFFEPHTHEMKKYPVFIHRSDDDLFSLAGIYTIIGKHVTFSILTKAADPFFAKIHNEKKRQPVILNKEAEATWLNEDLDTEEIKTLIRSEYPVSTLEAYPVSRDIYKRTVDSNVSGITERVNYSEIASVSFQI
jgi:putative SOS response-associated peptidase YedK